jgi:hypothetical protein
MVDFLNLQCNRSDKKIAVLLLALVPVFVILTLTQDVLRSEINNSPYYFSESFIFSSFWWIFAPLLFLQYYTLKGNKPYRILMYIIFIPIILHLLMFPFLVWLLSSAFYYHTFIFAQTFKYALSEHVFTLLLMYSLPPGFYFYFSHKKKKIMSSKSGLLSADNYISFIFVSEGNHKLVIPVSDILYFISCTPYVKLISREKKYLFHETLKSLTSKLHPEQFVRIHKTAIINIKMVESYTTRLNGDYDVLMKNKEKLRVSRNYASEFKQLFNATHHLKAK